jgi:hypothetical protein
VIGTNWKGRSVDFKMIDILRASMLVVCGLRMIYSLILATQTRKIFYLPDTKLGDKWQVVQTFDHRHLYNVSQSDSPHYNAPAYQEDECFEVDGQRQAVSDNTYE